MIGSLTVTDQGSGDSHTFTVDDNRLGVVAGPLKLKDGVSLDHEMDPQVQLTVTATVAGDLSHSEEFEIAVGDSSESPTDIELDHSSVNENINLNCSGLSILREAHHLRGT